MKSKVKKIIKRLIAILISLIVTGIQIVVYYFVFFRFSTIPELILIADIIAIFIVFRIYRGPMNNSYKLSWTIFILLIPFFGAGLYILFGNGRSIPKKQASSIREYLKDKIPVNDCLTKQKEDDIHGNKIAMTIHTNTKYPLYQNTEVKFFADTLKKHEAMLEAIKRAKKYVFIEYFIVCEGKLLDSLYNVLYEKGCEGIEIKMLYDDLGSKRGLYGLVLKKFKQIPNMTLAVYGRLTLTFNPTVNYRNHRKMVVIDGKVAFVGGDNLADEYIHKKIRFGHWRDNAIMLEGEAVKSFVLLFSETWYFSTKSFLILNNYFADEISCHNDNYVMPFGDGPADNADTAYELFISMIVNASKYVYISTPYLIIDNSFINNIKLASKSGIDVKILVPFIPDKKTVFWMTRAHYGEILKSGGKIYEYTPGFNHAKNIISDDKYAFVGTVNCDYRSMFLHFECGCFFSNEDEIHKMRIDFEDAISKSEEVTLEKWRKRPLFHKITEFFLNIIAPLL